MTLLSLAMPAKIVTEAGFLLCIIGGTLDGFKAITLKFPQLATLSRTILFLSTKEQMNSLQFFRWSSTKGSNLF